MERRKLLIATGTGVSSLTGCLGDLSNTNTDDSPRIALGEIFVYAHPESDLTDPIDVNVTVEKDGAQMYQQIHKLRDLSRDDGFSIQKTWMGSKVPYTVTVETSIHDEPRSFSTLEYDEQVDEYWLEDTECLQLQFQIYSWQIRPSPNPAMCIASE